MVVRVNADVRIAEGADPGEIEETVRFALRQQGHEVLAVRARRLPAEPCLHRLERLPEAERPYRYRCVDCRGRLKLASGIVLA